MLMTVIKCDPPNAMNIHRILWGWVGQPTIKLVILGIVYDIAFPALLRFKRLILSLEKMFNDICRSVYPILCSICFPCVVWCWIAQPRVVAAESTTCQRSPKQCHALCLDENGYSQWHNDMIHAVPGSQETSPVPCTSLHQIQRILEFPERTWSNAARSIFQCFW